MAKYKVTGQSGQSEVIEAADVFEANKQFVEHHGEPSVLTQLEGAVKGTNSAYIEERDTYHD